MKRVFLFCRWGVRGQEWEVSQSYLAGDEKSVPEQEPPPSSCVTCKSQHLVPGCPALRKHDRCRWYSELREGERSPWSWKIYLWALGYYWWEVVNLGGKLRTGKSSASHRQTTPFLPAAELNLTWERAGRIMNPQQGTPVKRGASIFILHLFMILKEDWGWRAVLYSPCFDSDLSL